MSAHCINIVHIGSTGRGDVAPRVATAQHGFTLVEALVALVVLSVGLLGVAKLVLGAVHADDSAYMRSQATQLAYELLDEMRANRPGAIANDYALAPAANDCSSGPCAPDKLAELDMFNWNARVAAALPGGAALAPGIATDAFNDTIVTVTVRWDDSLAQAAFGGGGAQSVTLESIL